ncbi:MAG: queuosine precursor transporter [Burkholderiales bacterium]
MKILSRISVLFWFTLALSIVILISNILVQTPINNWLTWGAITYPFSFLIIDLANRFYGKNFARQVVYVGFVIAVVLSAWYATPRIGVASGLAFLSAELLDVSIFDWLRRRIWWQAPLVSTLLGSVVDTVVFFTLAFYGTDMPWITLGVGDLAVKFVLAFATLVPFRVALVWARAAR